MGDEARKPRNRHEVEVEEPWGHPGPPRVDEVPPDLEARRREMTRRQQKMTEDKTGKAD